MQGTVFYWYDLLCHEALVKCNRGSWEFGPFKSAWHAWTCWSVFMSNLHRCLIAFGANLGDPAESFEQSKRLLSKQELGLVATSRLHRTVAVGGPAAQPDYQNAAILADTSLAPQEIVDLLLQTERQLGRMRDKRWGARTVDLDLLMVGDLVISSADVVVPHPRMTWRKFVLGPAAEVVPDMLHPLSGLSVGQLRERLDTLPRHITWLSREADGALFQKVAAAVGDRGEIVFPGDKSIQGENDRWKIVVGGSQSEIVSAAASSRLLVWDSRQWDKGAVESGWARHFPGAVMDLGLPNLAADVEISAAIDAMSTV